MGRRLFQALRYSADGFRLEDFRQGQALTSEIGGEDGVDGHRQIHTIAVDIGAGGNGYRLTVDVQQGAASFFAFNGSG